MINLFEKAIAGNQLSSFALGKKEYFVLDREYGTHSVLASWLNHVVPLYPVRGSSFVNDKIETMLMSLIDSSDIGLPEKAETILYHLHVYYYLASEKRIEAIGLQSLASKILDILDKYLEVLRADNDNGKINAIANALALIKSRGGLIG